MAQQGGGSHITNYNTRDKFCHKEMDKVLWEHKGGGSKTVTLSQCFTTFVVRKYIV